MSNPADRRALAEAVQALVKTNQPTTDHYAAICKALGKVATQDFGIPINVPLQGGMAATDAPPQVALEVLAELQRATVKFPTWPTDPLHALAVLGEEFGELNKALLQLTYEPHKTTRAEVRTEALQTAAMALRLLMSLDRYEYRPGAQHSQQEGKTA
jgi:hypothetical protein